MKVLLIGGTRFIGAYVARCLHDLGAEITAFHRGVSRNAILPEIEHIHDPAGAYPVVAFPPALARDWDLVIHMVAMGQDDAAVAAQTFAGRARRFVLISSCDVYRAYGRLTKSEPGPPDCVPLDEQAPLRTALYPYRGMEPQLAYAHDYEKILAERAVQDTPDLNWTILRLGKIYGPEDNHDLATVYGFQGAPEWRWTHAHVRNAAAAIVAAATSSQGGKSVFNIGEATTPSMGERLADLPCRPGAVPPLPDFDFRQHLFLDTRKIRTLLGYADVLDERAAMRALATAAAGQTMPTAP